MSSSIEDIQKQLIGRIPAELRDRFINARSSKKLDLSSLHSITSNELIQFVIPFLNANPTITTLDIRGNRIGDAGRNALLQAHQCRIEKLKKVKCGFLSVMTLTNSNYLEPTKRVPNEEILNAEKQKTMLFKYRQGISIGGTKGLNRLDNYIIKDIFSYIKYTSHYLI